jgi:hypothetical protein
MLRARRDRLGDDALVLGRAQELDTPAGAPAQRPHRRQRLRFLAFLHFLEEFELELLDEFELELLEELLDEFELELLDEFELELPNAMLARALSGWADRGAAAAGAAATATTIPVAPSRVAYVFQRVSISHLVPVGDERQVAKRA